MNETNEIRQARAAEEFERLPLAEKAIKLGRRWQTTTQAAEYILTLETRLTKTEGTAAKSEAQVSTLTAKIAAIEEKLAELAKM